MEQPNEKISQVKMRNAEQFEKYLMVMRYQLTPDLPDKIKIQSSLSRIINQLESIHIRISTGCLKFSTEQKFNDPDVMKQGKTAMYYFQVLNLILINLTPEQKMQNLQPELIQRNLNLFVEMEKKFLNKQSKAFKAFLIFYFNMIKRLNPSFVTPQQVPILFEMLSKILYCYFFSHSEKSLEKETKFKEETEWMGFIFQALPSIDWKSLDQNLSESFVQNYFTLINKKDQVETKKSHYRMIHMLGNFLHLVIESRTTTELVHGYECTIQDVKELYSKPNKDKLCNVKLQQKDVEFIAEFLIQSYKEEKNTFRHIFSNIQQTVQKASQLLQDYILSAEQNEVEQFDKRVKESGQVESQITVGDMIIELINVLNSVLFLGGYSPKLQTFLFQRLFKDNILPEFLQLAYLIYNERRFLGKYSIKVTMAKPPDANLSKLLEIDYESITKSQRQTIFKLIGQEIKYGQLSVLLRLMTNMVHINNEALSYFEKYVKYLHMVMSLTHDSQMNLTMKNWAVLFIKNCCDSQVLREEISKIQIQMKVEE